MREQRGLRTARRVKVLKGAQNSTKSEGTEGGSEQHEE